MRSVRITLCITIAGLFFLSAGLVNPAGATAQSTKEEQQSPQQVQELMNTMMGPMMGKMMESMMDSLFKVLAKPESSEKLATFIKNFYDALIAKGFSEEEAIKIIISIGIPSAPTMK